MLTELELADVRERCHQAGLGYERPDANQYHKDVKALLAELGLLRAELAAAAGKFVGAGAAVGITLPPRPADGIECAHMAGHTPETNQ